MESIVNGEKVEGNYWLGQINAPKYVLDLVVLSQLNLTPESQRRTLVIDCKEHTAMAIPLIDIGFMDEDRIHDAILKGMGYGEDNLPPQ